MLNKVTDTSAQTKYTKWFTEFLTSIQNKDFQKILDNAQTYRLQIIYTQINRDKNNEPHFTDHYFHVNDKVYFNPASTVKFPLTLLSLDKLNRLKKYGISKNTKVTFDSAYGRQISLIQDSTSQTGFPSIAHFIKKALLVSDNDAYNRMYEFVGPQEINRSLHAKGYKNVRIMHRFVPMSVAQNRHTNPVNFWDGKGSLLYTQPMLYNKDRFDHTRNEMLGKMHMTADGKLLNEPFDFSKKNRISLEELHRILRVALFPETAKKVQRFNLTEDDYRFLYQYLSQFPRETNFPKYDEEKFYDSFVKFFFRDSTHKALPDGVRVFNKVGWSYGFLTDNAYVADFKNNIEFMLSATIYVNSNDIINDGNYDYETVGHPFLYQLGQAVYQYELQRARAFAPDLVRFQMQYEKRKTDNRPTIREVDN